MANVKITELTNYTTPASTDVLMIVDLVNDQTKKIAVSELLGTTTQEDGSEALPGFRFTNDIDTGMWRPGDNQLAFSTGGVGRLYISDDGKIGIGTSAPSDFNFLADDLVIAPTTTTAGINLVASTGNYIFFSDADADGEGRIHFDHASNSFRIAVGGSERFRITSDGKIGIGETSPDQSLHLKDTNAFISITNSTDTGDAGILFRRDDSNQNRGYVLYDFTDNALKFRASLNGSGESMRINALGYLGIGVTAPANILHLNKSDSGSVYLHCTNSTTGATANDGALIGLSGSEELTLFNRENNDIKFGTNDIERARINSSGSLQIGGSVNLGSQLLQIQGGSNSTSDVIIANSVASANQTSTLTFAPANNVTGARIICHAEEDFSVSANRTARLEFYTRKDGTLSEAMRISSAGKVGIGGIDPDLYSTDADNLVIKGTAHEGISIIGGNANSSNIYFGDSDAFNRGIIKYNHVGDEFIIRTAGSDAVLIDSSGNVGIGTTSPSSLLTVEQSSGNVNFELHSTGSGRGTQIKTHNDHATFYHGLAGDTSGDFIYYTADAVDHVFSTSNSEAMRIDSSGRLLVGVSSAPSAQQVQAANTVGENFGAFRYVDSSGACDIALHKSRGSLGSHAIVLNNDAIGSIAFRASDGSAFQNAATIVGRVDGTPGASDMPGRLVFSTSADGSASPTERVRITSQGFTLIGTSFASPHATSTESERGIALRRDVGILVGVTDTHAGIFARYDSDGECVRFQRDSVDVGSIDVTTTATSYNTSSDYRLKENVVDIADGITRVKQLQPKRFNFIADADTTVDGFIAHEAQTVVPEAVTGTHNEVDDDGNAVMQGIDQSKLVPLLTAALQEAIAKIETLEAKVAALEAG